MSDSPLAGLTVVELAEAMAGPYCGMLLGDLGADVIKVERPAVGDQARGWGPPFLEGESAYFLSVNRNKRSIELDVTEPGDVAVLHALLTRADVFVTSMPRMASLERAGLDPGSLERLNPRLVTAAVSGYGHSGPKAGRGGYDIIAQGEAGLMALTGADADGEPSRFPAPMADISAGIHAALGTLGALYARDNAATGTGRGQLVDVSLIEAQAAWLANLAGSWFATGERPARHGNAHPTITPYQPVRARDRHLIIAVGNERLWQRFCAALGAEDSLMADARFATNADRNRHRAELVHAIETRLADGDADEWIDTLLEAGVPAGPINFPDQTLADEHLRARGFIVELEHPLTGVVRSLALPVHFSHTGPSYRRPPPRLGEHNAEVRALAADA